MKAWAQLVSGGIGWCYLLGLTWSAGAQPSGAPASAGAIQAIQQAPDPSAVVTAYANGIAVDRNDPQLYHAYIARMVDLGLPELAYHQAETLTTLQSNNGLAWGVVAYVNARRGQMPEAVAAINLAGQFAPENKFVAHTAGELLAWYDLKADKASLPDNAKDGLAKVRAVVGKQLSFTEAYDTARKAYLSQGKSEPQPTQVAPLEVTPGQTIPAAAPQINDAPLVPSAPLAPAAPQAVIPAEQPVAVAAYAAPVYYPVYYPYYSYWGPDYCYAWGPGWIAPAAWWWWQPCGFWTGCSFFAFGAACLYGDGDDYHHSDHDGHSSHDGHSGHGQQNAHNGGAGHERDPAAWHGSGRGQNDFFGSPARPSASLAQSAPPGSQSRAALNASNGRSSWSSSPGSPRTSSISRSSLSSGQVGTARPAMATSSRSQASIMRPQPNSVSRSWVQSAPVARPATAGSKTVSSTSQTFRNTRPTVTYSTRSYSVPRSSAGSAGSLGAYRAAPSYRTPSYTTQRGAARSAPSYRPAPAGGNAWRSPSVSAAPRSHGASPSRSFSRAYRDPSGGGFRGGSPGGGAHGGGGGGGHR